MHQHVLGGRLWYKECQDANQDLPHQLPLNYDSPDHYVSTFEPLLFEEAREAVRSTWLESCDMKKTFTVDITRCGTQAHTCTKWNLSPRHRLCNLPSSWQGMDLYLLSIDATLLTPHGEDRLIMSLSGFAVPIIKRLDQMAPSLTFC